MKDQSGNLNGWSHARSEDNSGKSELVASNQAEKAMSSWAEFLQYAALKNVKFGVQASRDARMNREDDQRIADLGRADKIFRSRHPAVFLG